MKIKDIVELDVERPVAGGDMLARHDGAIVFVSGAIPGERVRAEIERTTRQATWARVVDVVTASPERRVTWSDPACGGLAYAHIRYDRQLQLKAEIIADAFRRIGRLPLDMAVPVHGSPEEGYRFRARLHVRDGRAGFFREGTHTLCDAGPTRQLREDTHRAVNATLARVGDGAGDVEAVIVAENVEASERVVHLDFRAGRRPRGSFDLGTLPVGVSGVTMASNNRVLTLAGAARVTDRAADLLAGEDLRALDATWTRTAVSFFQGNRFLTGALVAEVLRRIPVSSRRIADLYAGVGLFAVALVARGADVVAVEGDSWSSGDLQVNARPWHDRLSVLAASVEDAAPGLRAGAFDAIVIDPPRTGVSPLALHAITRLAAQVLVYVSCDPATLARDAAKLVSAGYGLAGLAGYDLFPNTAHVEAVATFVKRG